MNKTNNASKENKYKSRFNYSFYTKETPLFMADISHSWWEEEWAKWFIIIGGTILSMFVFFISFIFFISLVDIWAIPLALVCSFVFAHVLVAFICSK